MGIGEHKGAECGGRDDQGRSDHRFQALTVTPASGAKITKADRSTGSASDIHVGDRIVFQGMQQGATISATDIRVMGGGFGPFGGFSRP